MIDHVRIANRMIMWSYRCIGEWPAMTWPTTRSASAGRPSRPARTSSWGMATCHQAAEVYGGRPVFYSLGNLIFDWPVMSGRHTDGLLVNHQLGGSEPTRIVAVRRSLSNVTTVLDSALGFTYYRHERRCECRVWKPDGTLACWSGLPRAIAARRWIGPAHWASAAGRAPAR